MLPVTFNLTRENVWNYCHGIWFSLHTVKGKTTERERERHVSPWCYCNTMVVESALLIGHFSTVPPPYWCLFLPIWQWFPKTERCRLPNEPLSTTDLSKDSSLACCWLATTHQQRRVIPKLCCRIMSRVVSEFAQSFPKVWSYCRGSHFYRKL